MRAIRLVLGMLWRYWFFLIATITFLALFPLFYLFLSHRAWFPYAFRLKKFWGHLFLPMSGLWFRIVSSPDLSKLGPCVITPNHASYLDIVFSFMGIPFYFHMMGKAELGKVPLFNKFFDGMNILVDRGSIVASHKSLRRAADDLDEGISIGIFPEATIPDSAPRLGRFKNGAFKLAIEKQVPVLPVIFLDNYRLMPDGRKVLKGGGPGLSRIVISDPVSTEGMTIDDVPKLRSQIFDIIESTLKQYIDGY
jgi:1-acyl-sn-glycerol-3-phosphate acyltransferase